MNEASSIANIMIKCFKNGGKTIICGNGGSAAEAQHFAGELVGKFEYDRQALPAIALTTDTSIITAWANDHEFETIFSRQLEALGKPGDVLIGLSTSGKSKNILRAYERAKDLKIEVIDLPRIGSSTPEIQEYQLKLIHQICRLVEKEYLVSA